MTIEVQCTSCHTRYRIDEQVLPEGTPTFKCSRCGHVFTIEPRAEAQTENVAEPAVAAQPRAKRRSPEARDPDPAPEIGEKNVPDAQSGWVVGFCRRGQHSSTKNRHRFRSSRRCAPCPLHLRHLRTAKPSTDELLSKPFHQDVSETGENLKFDFSDDRLEHEVPVADEFGSDRHSSEWQVGEPELETSLQSLNAARPRASTPGEGKANASVPESRARRMAMRAPKPAKPAEDEEFLDEDSAPIYNRGAMTHSARFVMALFMLIAFGYGVMRC